MKSTVVVLAQYHENYGSVENPSWKAKGSAHFKFEIDSDLFLYSNPKRTISELVTRQGNEMCQYRYIEHEILFNEPKVLCTEDEYLALDDELS